MPIEQPIRSSVPFQMLLYYNTYFSPCYVLLSVLMFWYKGNVLPYPEGTLGWEISFLVVYSIIESARLFEGKKGNLSEQAAPMAMFIFFSILVACVHFYFFQWQVFVLKLDRLLNIICFVFVGLELILGLVVTLGFKAAANSLQ